MTNSSAFRTINYIFDVISNDVAKGYTRSSVTFNYAYPQQAIVQIAKKGIVKVESVIKEVVNGKYKYTVNFEKIDDLNQSYSFDKKIEAKRWELEKAWRKGYDLNNMSVTTKFLTLNDRCRQELDCPNWSSEKDEYGYASCPNNINSGVEPMDLADSASFEAFICYNIGFDSYEQFLALDENEQNSILKEYEENKLECQLLVENYHY